MTDRLSIPGSVLLRGAVLLFALSMLSMQTRTLQTKMTDNFRIRYPRNISAKQAARVGKLLEEVYAEYRTKIGSGFRGKQDVVLVATTGQLRQQSVIFEDAAFHDAKIYVLPSKLFANDSSARQSAARVVARAILGEIPLCPPWLAESYSLYAGGQPLELGKPAQLTESSFSDLHEDYARAENEQDFREIYAKLAATSRFLFERYGEKKVEAVFAELKRGNAIEEALESSLGEKMNVIEKEWVISLQSAVK